MNTEYWMATFKLGRSDDRVYSTSVRHTLGELNALILQNPQWKDVQQHPITRKDPPKQVVLGGSVWTRQPQGEWLTDRGRIGEGYASRGSSWARAFDRIWELENPS
jgi:hypothetical protein